jgi:hypothetical protein
MNNDLIPYLKALKSQPNVTPRQKVISEIISSVERVRIDTERNLLDIFDKVHYISAENVDATHLFTLSQVYEGLLLKMGEKGNDGGQFFTPREVIRAMVKVIDPKVGEKVYDPCCGTGGFLAQAYEYMSENLDNNATADKIEALKRDTFYGREKENLVYPIALANLVLHGIDEPHIWHGALPLDVVDNSISHCERILGWFVHHWAVQTSLLFSERGSIRVLLRAASPSSSRHDTPTASGSGGSQTETDGKGHESTSRAVHRRFVLLAAMAGVRCR